MEGAHGSEPGARATTGKPGRIPPKPEAPRARAEWAKGVVARGALWEWGCVGISKGIEKMVYVCTKVAVGGCLRARRRVGG